MRLFPIPNNPYGPYLAATVPPAAPALTHRAVKLSARARTALATTLFTPFDLGMVQTSPPPPDNSPQPDVQDTILPETTMLRDATTFMQWTFAAARLVDENTDNERLVAERVFW